MSDRDLISIVVPVYGVQDYIGQCVASLLSQRHQNIEIILVNDGSADRSADICDGYASLDRRVRVVHKANGGLVSARKAGVAVATGEYLGFVDGDDWVSADFVESLYDHAASTSADLVIAGHIREFLGKCEAMLPRSAAGVYGRDDILDGLLSTAIYNGTFFQHGVSTYVWNKLFRRQKAARFLSEIDETIVMGEDAALTYPYLASSNRVTVCGSASYFYRQRSNSMVKSVGDIRREYHRLSALFRYLKRQFEGFSYSENVSNQLRHYFYAQVLVRSGACVQPTERLQLQMIPYPGLRPGQKIVVYSSGSFGQHLMATLKRLDKFELTGWIDDDDHESQRSGLPVTSVDSISTLDFDLVLIAAIDSEYADAVATRLEKKGVDREKISVLSVDFERLDQSLRDVGFDTQSFSFSDKTG